MGYWIEPSKTSYIMTEAADAASVMPTRWKRNAQQRKPL